MTPTPPATYGASQGVTCPFCGLGLPGSPNQCSRCGTLLGEAAGDLKRLGERERRLLRSRKATADTLFLGGLLLGGPMITLGGLVELGGFVVLAGGAASVLRRYTNLSLPGTGVISALLAGLAAVLVLEPMHHTAEESLAEEEARRAYAAALDAQDPDVHVEERGAGAVAIWFQLPQDRMGECGSYPAPEVRAHLAELGYLRVVVADQNQGGGLCSFHP